MSYPAWPEYALDPPPLNDSYKFRFPDLIIRTDFEQGPARQRRAFRNGPTTFSPTWAMTPAEFEFFKGWHKWIAGDGESWFTMPVFDGSDYHKRLVRFVKGPLEPFRDGGEWMTAAQLETMDNIYAGNTETALMMLTWGTETAAGDLADEFHAAVLALAADFSGHHIVGDGAGGPALGTGP